MEKNRYNGSEFRVSQEEFRSPAIPIAADASVVPCAGRNEILPITLAPFKDHGRPAFVASTISSRSVFTEVASGLSLDDSQRLNGLMSRTLEGLLDEGVIKSNAVLRSRTPGKPDIHVIISGDPFRANSLRLYCHVGEYEGARVLFQDARATKKDADRVEKAFRREGNYSVPQGWENRRN